MIPLGVIPLGSVVHVGTTWSVPAPEAYVVCGEDVQRRKLRLAYCGSQRWMIAKWYSSEVVTLATDEKNKHVRRARRLLAKIKPDPDGWRRIQTGRYPNFAMERVGHVALEGSVVIAMLRAGGGAAA